MGVQHGILKRSGIFGEAASIWGGCKSGMAGDETGVVPGIVDNFHFLFVFHPFLLRTAPSPPIMPPLIPGDSGESVKLSTQNVPLLQSR